MTCPYCGTTNCQNAVGSLSQMAGLGGLGQYALGMGSAYAAQTQAQMEALRGVFQPTFKTKLQSAQEYAAEVRERKPEMKIRKLA